MSTGEISETMSKWEIFVYPFSVPETTQKHVLMNPIFLVLLVSIISRYGEHEDVYKKLNELKEKWRGGDTNHLSKTRVI